MPSFKIIGLPIPDKNIFKVSEEKTFEIVDDDGRRLC